MTFSLLFYLPKRGVSESDGVVFPLCTTFATNSLGIISDYVLRQFVAVV